MKSFEVLEGGNKELKTSCTIKMGNTVENFSDFITVGYNMEKGKCSLFHNADVLVMALAVELTTNAFKEMYGKLSDEERAVVDEYIEGGP